MDYKKLLFIIFIMALVTYLPRAIPLAIFRKKIKNKFLQSFLLYIPYGVLATMVFPDIFYSTKTLVSAVSGTIIAIILAYKKFGLLTVALGATGAVLLVETFFV